MQLGNGFANLTDQMFDFDPLRTSFQKKDETSETSLRNGPKNVAQSSDLLTSITHNSMADPFANEQFLKRDNLGINALMHAAPQQTSPAAKGLLGF